MKTSTTSPRSPRKTSSTSAAKTAPADKKVAAPRVRRAAAPKPKKATIAPVAAPSRAVPTVEEVRVRAYEIYLQRNGVGDPVSDWLQAERELSA